MTDSQIKCPSCNTDIPNVILVKSLGPSLSPNKCPACQATLPAPVTAGASTAATGSAASLLGAMPTQFTCPSCKASVLTRVERKANTRTHVIALLLCLFLCWPCVFVPYCTDSCNNAVHYCPKCDAYLGTFVN